MLIRPRKVRKPDKFTPRWTATARRRKEQSISFFSTAVIQLVLFFFLLVGAYKSYVAIESRASGLKALEKWAVPGFFLIAAFFILRACVRNVSEAWTINRRPPEDDNRGAGC